MHCVLLWLIGLSIHQTGVTFALQYGRHSVIINFEHSAAGLDVQAQHITRGTL
jgi:hypothetical protein